MDGYTQNGDGGGGLFDLAQIVRGTERWDLRLPLHFSFLSRKHNVDRGRYTSPRRNDIFDIIRFFRRRTRRIYHRLHFAHPFVWPRHFLASSSSPS